MRKTKIKTTHTICLSCLALRSVSCIFQRSPNSCTFGCGSPDVQNHSFQSICFQMFVELSSYELQNRCCNDFWTFGIQKHHHQIRYNQRICRSVQQRYGKTPSVETELGQSEPEQRRSHYLTY